jgi:hypothetical protein
MMHARNLGRLHWAAAQTKHMRCEHLIVLPGKNICASNILETVALDNIQTFISHIDSHLENDTKTATIEGNE